MMWEVGGAILVSGILGCERLIVRCCLLWSGSVKTVRLKDRFVQKPICIFNEPQKHQDFIVHPELSIKITNMSFDGSVLNLQSVRNFFVA